MTSFRAVWVEKRKIFKGFVEHMLLKKKTQTEKVKDTKLSFPQNGCQGFVKRLDFDP